MRLLKRDVLRGDLAGKVEITIDDDQGREITFITTIGSDSDVQGAPASRPLAGRRFGTFVEEYNACRRGKSGPAASISQELHDKTGVAEKKWKARGGLYGRFRDDRGVVIAGPVFRNDREMREYIPILNEGRRHKVNEA
jgi:hypothetical protein